MKWVLFIGYSLVACSLTTATLQIPALGRPADLFYFYNIHQDEFHHVPSLLSRTPPRTTLPQPRGNVQCTSKIVSSLEDRLNSIGLDLRSKLDVLTGVVGMSGALTYATETKFDSESVYGVVHYRQFTLYENFHARLEEIQSQLSMYPYKILPATHIVIGVMWGVNVAISFRFYGTSISAKSKVATEVEMSLEKLAYAVQAGSKLDQARSNTSSVTSTEIRIFGDLLVPIIPRTIQDVESILQDIPNLLKSTSEKGTPQYYHVIEVEKLQQIIDYDLFSREQNVSQNIETVARDSKLVQLESLLLYIYEQNEQIANEYLLWRSRFRRLEFMYDDEFLEKLNKFCLAYESTFTYFNSKFKALLRQGRTRMNKRVKKEFVNITRSYNQHKFGPVNSKLQFNVLVEVAKSKYYDHKAFQKHGVQYASKHVTTNQIRLLNHNKVVYFLYYTQHLKEEYPVIWNEMTNWFITQWGIKYVVDCDLKIHEKYSCPPRNDTAIGGKIHAKSYDVRAQKRDYDMGYWLNDIVEYERRVCMGFLACHVLQKKSYGECINQELLNYKVHDESNYELELCYKKA